MLLHSSQDVEDNCSSNKRFEYILARTDIQIAFNLFDKILMVDNKMLHTCS